MQIDVEDSRETGEVAIRGQDGNPSPPSHRAEQEIRIRPLQAARATAIEAHRPFFVILRVEQQIRERSETVAQPFEVLGDSDARQKFLPNCPHHDDAALFDERAELAHLWRVVRDLAS
ncbi:MAG TPA: hypothetical protein VK540_24640 [Polyangiaceae bacterium]|nr:hypothetical protein [Polyangiaceae bacterium]